MITEEFIDSKLNEILFQTTDIRNKGMKNKLLNEDIDYSISRILFEAKLGEVRDPEEIKKRGLFKTEESEDVAYEEGLIDEDVHSIFKKIMPEDTRILSPFRFVMQYFFSIPEAPNFLSKQLAFCMIDYLKTDIYHPPYEFRRNLIVRVAPHGMDIGLSVRNYFRELIHKTNHPFWSPSLFTMDKGKTIFSISPENSGEGIVGIPRPEKISRIFLIDCMIDGGETISNSIKTLRKYGYITENGVEIIPTCVIYDKNSICEKRFKRLGVNEVIYLTTAKRLLKKGREMGLIQENQCSSAISYLNDVSEFMREISPFLFENQRN
jgi:hypothetical protein